MLHFRHVLTAAVCIAFAQANLNAQLVQPLPPPNPATASFAQSVNSAGVVVGFSKSGGTDTATIWRWTPAGYTAEFLPAASGFPDGAANAINTGGAIAGYGQPDDLSTAAAVVWTESGGTYSATALPTPAGEVLASAYAINAGGDVAGFSQAPGGTTSALVWTAGSGVATPLPPVPGQTDTVATAINDDGDIAGYSDAASGAVWLRDGTDYVPHSVIAVESTLITAMNIYGTGAGVYGGDKPLVTAYYEGDFYGTNLPMPFGASDGASNSVNNFDALVGYVKDPDTATTGPEAALWLPGEFDWDYVNLDRWLNQQSSTLGARWVLTDAMCLSDNWLVVGNGMYDADGAGPGIAVQRAFVLNIQSLIPEPAGVSILVGVAAAILGQRRSSRRN